MQARGPLMAEHRIIEKVIDSFHKKMEIMRDTKEADLYFIRDTMDFIRVYADKTHHGKEEDILFKKLQSKPMSNEDRSSMDELIEDHRWAREKMKKLEEANEKYAAGDDHAINDIIENIDELVAFYPGHIKKEDESFFPASREYFSREEEERMLKEFTEYDSRMIHEKYKSVQEELKGRV